MCPRLTKALIIWAFPGLFWDLFFPFSWYIVSIKLINLTVGSDDRKQEIGRNSRLHSITHYLRKSLTPSVNRQTAILNQKSLSPSWDLNPACSDRMLLLYHLCHTTTALVWLRRSIRPGIFWSPRPLCWIFHCTFWQRRYNAEVTRIGQARHWLNWLDGVRHRQPKGIN